MNGDPAPEGADAEEEALSAGDAAAALAPRFGPNDHALGDQKFMVSDTEIKESFGTGTYDSLSSGRSRWAARFSGEGLEGPSADPIATAALLRRLAITAKWMAARLFPGHRNTPGFVLGEATHSVVLEFDLGAEEKPVTVPLSRDVSERQDDQALERQTVYPTVEAGRFIGSLLALADDEEKLVQRFGLVGKQAVQTYQGGLREFVKYGAELDLLVPDYVEDNETELRRVNMPVADSVKELKVLDRKPRMESKTNEVEGLLYTQNSLKAEFGIKLDNGQHVIGEYDLTVIDKLGPAWDKRVWARIREEGPKEDWMPRAGRSRRVLVDVAVLEKGETRLGTVKQRRR